jgi:hypothetical protein
LPCADTKLLAPLKRSGEYRAIRPRVTDMLPLDHWQEEGLHFFVFTLRPEDGAGAVAAVLAAEPPVAVFAMHPEEPEPVSAVVVTPSATGKEAQVLDLRKPENAYNRALRAGDDVIRSAAGRHHDPKSLRTVNRIARGGAKGRTGSRTAFGDRRSLRISINGVTGKARNGPPSPAQPRRCCRSRNPI